MLLSGLTADVVVLVHLLVIIQKKTRVSFDGVIYYGLIERETPYYSYLFGGEAVHRVLGQGAVGLT